jgi:glycosyltransferase involved in cell wall biosynthesis
VNKQHESGIANKLFQYLYGGKPVVASNCRPQREMIESYQCGIVFTNQDEFVNALEELILHPELANTLGENGKRHLFAAYAGEAYENKLISIYQNLH